LSAALFKRSTTATVQLAPLAVRIHERLLAGDLSPEGEILVALYRAFVLLDHASALGL
jgi:hypothetical protein